MSAIDKVVEARKNLVEAEDAFNDSQRILNGLQYTLSEAEINLNKALQTISSVGDNIIPPELTNLESIDVENIDLEKLQEVELPPEVNVSFSDIISLATKVLEAKIALKAQEVVLVIAQTRKTIAEAAYKAALTDYQLEQIKELEIPDENVDIPVTVPFTVPVVGKQVRINTGTSVSVPLKYLAIASIAGSADGLIPEEVLTSLETVGILPEEGSLSGPAGTFSKGNSVAANVIATGSMSAPNIASSGALSGAFIQTQAATITGPVSITGATTISGATSITGLTSITGSAIVTGNLAVGTFLTTAALKAFDIVHPTKENKRLRYASLEGPEAGVYVRGKTSEGIIPLPDYWAGLVDEKTITVHLTPTHMDQTLVVNNVNGLTIQVLGNHRMPYYYYVMAERKDIDKLQVEYDA